MKRIRLKSRTIRIPADTRTPVSTYLALRDKFPNSVLLEASDYKCSENSRSIIGLGQEGFFKVENGILSQRFPGGIEETDRPAPETVPDLLHEYLKKFEIDSGDSKLGPCGLFGYSSFDAVRYFEKIKFREREKDEAEIPEICYNFYRYVLNFNHFNDELDLSEILRRRGQPAGRTFGNIGKHLLRRLQF